MTTSIASQVFERGWIVNSENGLKVSDEIDECLTGLYEAIEANAVWKEAYLAMFQRHKRPIITAEEYFAFDFLFSFVMRSCLPAELCDIIMHCSQDKDTPLAKIVNGEFWLCRGQIVPLALYNHFILRS